MLEKYMHILFAQLMLYFWLTYSNKLALYKVKNYTLFFFQRYTNEFEIPYKKYCGIKSVFLISFWTSFVERRTKPKNKKMNISSNFLLPNNNYPPNPLFNPNTLEKCKIWLCYSSILYVHFQITSFWNIIVQLCTCRIEFDDANIIKIWS